MKTQLKNVCNSKLNNVLLKYVFLLLVLLSSLKTTNAQIFINEFQASNNTMVPEMYDFDDFPDWIELYNSGDEVVSLANYSLTDDLTDPKKYVFPSSVTILPKGYFHIWADNHNSEPGEIHDRTWEWANQFTTIYYHLPFKLKISGEEIALFSPTGDLLDHIDYDQQVSDASYGRKPDGSNNWIFFGDPTPNASNTTNAYTNTSISAIPKIFPDGGFYNESILVSVTSTSNSTTLRYTLDGSLPTEDSPIFTTPLTIETTTTIRVRAYDEGKLPAIAQSQSYNFNTEEYDLPIITLTTDPSFLWDQKFGIYTNELKQRDLPIKVEYYENKSTKILSTYATMRISGQFSYQYPQKPFTITAKSKFGDDFLNYPFFNNIDNNKYKNIYLRNSGWPDINFTFFRDALSHTIIYNHMNLDAQSYQPTVTYLNGDFWGIYNIREKLKGHYFEYHHNVNPDNIDLLEYDDYSTGPDSIIVNEGDSKAFDELLVYLKNNSLSDSINYEYIKTKIEVDEYINYMITEIFVDNNNWQHANVKWWREREEDAKWRWIFLDADYGFGISEFPSHNLLLETLTEHWSNFLFIKMNESESFNNEFIQRFAAYLNTVFKEDRTIAIVDSLKNNIATAIPYHANRWNTLSDWDNNVKEMREFARDRPPHQRQHIKDQYNINSIIDLDITVVGGEGIIYANDVWLWEGSLSGKYFGGIPIRLKAVPKPGYVFIEWEGLSSKNTYTTTLDSNTTIKAIFAPTNECRILSIIDEDLILNNSCEYYVALGDVIINENVTLKITEGVEIRMPQSANIYVKGSLVISGTEESPVTIKPNQNIDATTWGGLCFDNASDTSIIKNLNLQDASSGDNSIYIAAISAIHSDVILEHVKVNNVRKPFYSKYGKIHINNCNFQSPYTCDLINIKHAEMAIVENCNLEGNDAPDTDAIDLDNVTTGIVRGNYIYGFNGSNSDGIDLGEACNNILIEHNYISTISDKAISVGQASTCTLAHNVIIGCAQGVGIKDFNSYAYINQNTFYGNEYAVACFEKNIGSGGGNADIKNSILSSSTISSIYNDEFSQITTTYSLSDTDTISGDGNISLDPMFVEESILNLELKDSSPCIDTGDPSSPYDLDNTIADMGAKYSFSIPIREYTIVINEINYNAPNNNYNSKDWVELYNYGETEIDISGWYFFDDNYTHKYHIENGTTIQPGAYLILGNDSKSFQDVYGLNVNYIGDFDFGLGNSGDIVRLFDSNLSLVDYVEFDDKFPWPTCTDGDGASLMLLDHLLDNNLPENWSKSCGYPTPGENNYNSIADFDFDLGIEHTCSGLVQFNNKSTGINDLVSWDFGDGTITSKSSPSHQYEATDTYTVRLIVFSNGMSSMISKEVTIESYLKAPEVQSGYSCGPDSIKLQAISSGSSYWFKNKNSIEPFYIGETYTTTFLDSSITFYVANILDSCSSIRVPVEAIIYEEVVSDFDFTVDEYKVTFDNKSQNTSNYIWDFGDGEISMESTKTIIHEYTEKGSFSVSLTSSNESENCDSIIKKEILIEALSTSNYSDNKKSIISPNPFIDKLNILLPNNTNEASIEVSDINGKKVLSTIINSIEADGHGYIDLSKLSSGIYILKIHFKDQYTVHKIIKE